MPVFAPTASRMRRAFRGPAFSALAALVLGLGGPMCLQAQAPIPKWPLRSLGPDLGLTSDVARVMSSDSRGFLWLGTEAGLFRFDGHRFIHFPGPDGSALLDIRALQEDGKGRLWIATPRRLACLTGSQMQHVHPGVQGPVLVLARGPGGAICLGSPSGPIRQREDGTFAPLPGWPGGEATALASGTDPGELLIARRPHAQGPTEVLITDGRGTWRNLGTVPGVEQVQALLETRQGRVFVRTTTALYQRGRDIPGFLPLGPRSMPVELPSLQLDPQDGVWVPFEHGILLCREAEVPRIIQAELRPLTTLRGLFIDPQQGLWIFTHGLYRAPSLGSVSVHPARELGGTMAWCFHRDRAGQFWMGTSKGVFQAKGPKWEPFVPAQDLAIRSIAEGPDGRLWMAGNQARLLLLDPRTGISTFHAFPPVQETGKVLRLRFDPGGTLWIATEKAGLLSLAAGATDVQRTSLTGRVSDLALDPAGRMLAATEQGLAVREGASWRLMGPAEGLPCTQVSYLRPLQDGSLLLAPTGPKGVFHVRLEPGRIQVHRHILKELPSPHVFLLHEDRSGAVWIGTNQGLSRFGREGDAHFNRADGLPGEDFCAQAAFEDRDGSLWFGTTLGVLRLEADSPFRPQAAPATQLLSLRLGNTNLPADIRQVHGNQASNDFEAAFSALRYAGDASLQYQARLKGLEEAWRPLTLPLVHYPHLPPGRYTLEVRARQHLGAWGPTLTLPVVIRPAWHQTPLVQLGGLALLLAGASLWHRWRLRRQAAPAPPPEIPPEPQAPEGPAPAPWMAGSALQELRLPLRAIQGLNRVLDMPTDPQASRSQRLIQEAAGRLDEVLNDLQTLERIRTESLNPQPGPVQIRPLLDEAVARLESRAREREVPLLLEVAPQVPAWLHLDGPRVRQLILNLLGTALSLTRHGPLRVRLDVVPAKDRLLIQVQDEGEGLPHGRLAQALGPEGPGLGLAPRLAGCLGGETGTRLLADHGCTYWASIPAPPEPGTPVPDAPPPCPPLTQCLQGRLLVADDSPVNRALVDTVATRLGLEVDFVEDAQAFEAALSMRAYQLAILEPTLPGMEAPEHRTEIQRLAEHQGIPVLTFQATESETSRHPLEKPIDPQAFQAVLIEHLAHSSGIPDLDRPHLRQLEDVLGGREALLEYALDLEQDTRRRLLEIETFLLVGDWERVGRLAHDLKTNTGNLGLRRVQAAAEALDEAAGQGRRESLPPLFTQLEQAWTEGWEAFRREVE